MYLASLEGTFSFLPLTNFISYQAHLGHSSSHSVISVLLEHACTSASGPLHLLFPLESASPSCLSGLLPPSIRCQLRALLSGEVFLDLSPWPFHSLFPYPVLCLLLFLFGLLLLLTPPPLTELYVQLFIPVFSF